MPSSQSYHSRRSQRQETRITSIQHSEICLTLNSPDVDSTPARPTTLAGYFFKAGPWKPTSLIWPFSNADELSNFATTAFHVFMSWICWIPGCHTAIEWLAILIAVSLSPPYNPDLQRLHPQHHFCRDDLLINWSQQDLCHSGGALPCSSPTQGCSWTWADKGHTSTFIHMQRPLITPIQLPSLEKNPPQDQFGHIPPYTSTLT